MNRLKDLRIAKNLTLNKMAEMLGVVQRTYQKYETGEIDPPLSKLLALADYFDCSLDYLVGRSDNPRRL